MSGTDGATVVFTGECGKTGGGGLGEEGDEGGLEGAGVGSGGGTVGRGGSVVVGRLEVGGTDGSKGRWSGGGGEVGIGGGVMGEK